mmetsp:Transcript_11523/g.21542  ORF Transcript_11523/g.21542 Transcript_11523/m.21542 type:complete len:113 (+) Transcript_11523:921-1259(+)
MAPSILHQLVQWLQEQQVQCKYQLYSLNSYLRALWVQELFCKSTTWQQKSTFFLACLNLMRASNIHNINHNAIMLERHHVLLLLSTAVIVRHHDSWKRRLAVYNVAATAIMK